MATPIDQLNDLFTATSLNAQWTQFTAGSATMSYTTNGASTVYPATTSSATDGDLASAAQYDLTGKRACLNVTSVPTGSTSSDCTFGLRASGSAANVVQMQFEGGTLFAQKIVASAQTNLTSVAYNAIKHAWWSIRELNGTTIWETSADGHTWNFFFSASNPITLTSVTANIAGTSFGVDSNNLPFSWRSFNQYASSQINHVKVADGMSRSEVAN